MTEVPAQQPALPSQPAAVPPNPYRPRRVVPAWVGWLGLALALGVAGYFLFFWKATLTITVQPASATISVGETSSTTGQLEVKLRPGRHALAATFPDHIPYSQEVTLGAGQERSVDIVLRPLPRPVELSDHPAQFLTVDQERNSLLYLNPASRTIERLLPKFDGSSITDPVTPARFAGVTELLWSPDRQLAFYREQGSLKQYDFKRYDLVNQVVTDWPDSVHAIDWRPDGAKVAYVNIGADGERTLVRAETGGQAPERIYDFDQTAITDPKIWWSPNSRSIAILEEHLFVLDVFSKELHQLPAGDAVRDVRWLPTSDRLLLVDGQGQLSIIGLEGEPTPLGRSGQLDRIALFANGSVLVQATGSDSNLRLERVDLGTGQATPYAVAPSSGFEPTNLILSSDESILYVQSGGRPHALRLDLGTYDVPASTQ